MLQLQISANRLPWLLQWSPVQTEEKLGAAVERLTAYL